MLVGVGAAVIVIAVAVAIWLAITALNQIRQLRSELDETQRQFNELKATAEAPPVPPPPLPRTRSTGLEDLREELRAAHREEAASEE